MALTYTQSNVSRQAVLQKPAVESQGGIVASQHRRASEIGVEVLNAGGNAYDAAVAVSFALGVLEPWMSGPFGGGAMMVAPAGGPVQALYYGMRAPKRLQITDYPLAADGHASDLFPWKAVEGDRNVHGALAVAVPGTAAGITALHARHGTMPWAELLQPAIAAAREGLLVDWYAGLMIASRAEVLSRDPDASTMFLLDGKWAPMAGWTALAETRLNMQRMADTLGHLAVAGGDDFYRGDLARMLVSDLQAKGSRIALDDLESYQAQWQDPLAIGHRGATIFATPFLTAGPTLARMLAHLSAHDMPPEAGAPRGSDYIGWAQALQSAYLDRLANDGDPEPGNEHPQAPSCTTHFAIVDRAGNMLSMTQTLLSAFGAAVVSPSTGLMMNNGIMWFDPEPGRPNSIGPGKRCLMNICPIIADKDGTRAAIGASGGRKILPAVAQIALMVTDHALSLNQAIHTPRIDVSGGPSIMADALLPYEVLQALGERFDTVVVPRSFSPLAYACPIAVSRRAGMNTGACEVMMPWADAVAQG
ncbi:gamma-glutamyltransferase [Paracoccus sp. 11-3]|uniref:Gamma-glutamyltransferase n=1 Tax=Paracoccus amoyensis TaxID=2760093 RepID=A0A926GHW7_9RHOB|nr:gamma-glutamyltransferase [Paracoccus amoyensis]MBC9247624.1 gamma-glutamyltransferase [Paracoccus amoyensis]